MIEKKKGIKLFTIRLCAIVLARLREWRLQRDPNLFRFFALCSVQPVTSVITTSESTPNDAPLTASAITGTFPILRPSSSPTPTARLSLKLPKDSPPSTPSSRPRSRASWRLITRTEYGSSCALLFRMILILSTLLHELGFISDSRTLLDWLSYFF